MKWLFLAAGAAALSFLLLMRLKRTNGRRGERVPFFEPAGRFLAEKLPWSEKEKEKKARTLRELYGEKDLPEQLLRYRTKLFGHLLLLLVIGCFTLFALGFCGKEESPISGDLPREEESGSISVEALIEGEEEPHSVTVDLPALEPTLEEKVQWLAEADDFIADYFEELGPLSAAPDFPASWGHATFDYYSLDPLVLDDEARFYEGWPAEEYQAVFRVLVWVEDLKSSVDVTLYFVPAAELALSTQWQLLREQILAGSFTEETQVRLPAETAGGLAVRWQLPSTKPDPGAGFLLLLLLLFLYKNSRSAASRPRGTGEKPGGACLPGAMQRAARAAECRTQRAERVDPLRRTVPEAEGEKQSSAGAVSPDRAEADERLPDGRLSERVRGANNGAAGRENGGASGPQQSLWKRANRGGSSPDERRGLGAGEPARQGKRGKGGRTPGDPTDADADRGPGHRHGAGYHANQRSVTA